MPEPLTLSADVTQQIERSGPADFVVGIGSQAHAATIGGVVRAAWEGLERSFPGARVAVVHADAGARDGTLERAREAMPAERLVQASVVADRPPRAAPALALRADTLRVLFTIAERLGARGCAVLGADVTNASPAWVQRLLEPVRANTADFVAPCYARHRFAGAITTSVLYPFLRAVYGKRIRFPVGGELACSDRLLRRYLAADIWQADVTRLGIDVELCIQALAGGFRLAQAPLGVRTLAASEGPDLAETLARVLGVLFLEAERTVSVWQKLRGSEPVPLNGTDGSQPAEPVALDAKPLLESFRLGARALQEIWAPALPPLTLLELQKLARTGDGEFRFPDALWARTVYDFALAYHGRVMHRDHLVSAFTPLYAGWLGSWVSELHSATEQEAEARVEQLCLHYEAEKPYFIARWRSPDRFSP